MTNWYCISTAPRKAPAVELRLLEKRFEVFLPMASRQVRRGKSRDRELYSTPLYGPYLFVQEPHDWFDLMNTLHVRQALGVNGEPKAIPQKEIDRIAEEAKDVVLPNPHKWLEVGDTARVTAGPYEGWKVPVLDIRQNKVKVPLEIFGSVREIEVDMNVLQVA